MNGFAVIPDLFSRDETDWLCATLNSAQDGSNVRRKSGIYAIRNLLAAVPEVADLAASTAMSAMAR